jgi:putative membrane protein
MLFVHIGLSIVAVPVVIHAVVLGLTHTPAELAETVHPRVGRVAVAAWSLSLFLGIVTYVLLNWVYGSEPREAVLWFFVVFPATRPLRHG